MPSAHSSTDRVGASVRKHPKIFGAVAVAGVTALVGWTGHAISGGVRAWYFGPVDKAASIESLNVNSVTKIKSSVDPYWFEARVRFNTKGLHKEGLKLYPWLYDGDSSAQIADFVGINGTRFNYEALTHYTCKQIKVTAQSENALVRLNVPVPLISGHHHYFIGVSLFNNNDELDYKVTNIMTVTPQRLIKLDKLYFSHAAETALAHADQSGAHVVTLEAPKPQCGQLP